MTRCVNSTALYKDHSADHGQLPPRLLHSQFFAPVSPSSSLGSRTSPSSTQTLQFASSTSHPSLADARLRSLISQVQTKLADKTPRQVVVASGSVPNSTEEDLEIQKQAERETARGRQDLEDRVKDLEVEVTCARAKEQEAKRLAEQFAREHAEAVYVYLSAGSNYRSSISVLPEPPRPIQKQM